MPDETTITTTEVTRTEPEPEREAPPESPSTVELSATIASLTEQVSNLSRDLQSARLEATAAQVAALEATRAPPEPEPLPEPLPEPEPEAEALAVTVDTPKPGEPTAEPAPLKARHPLVTLFLGKLPTAN